MGKERTIRSLSEDAARRLGDLVRDHEAEPLNELIAGRRRDRSITSYSGKLASTLARKGRAKFTVWEIGASGGLKSPTTHVLEVIDVGQIAADASPLPVGVTIAVVWQGSRWVLVSYDCDLEIETT